MEISYWKSRWKNDRIGWHTGQVYPPLVSNWKRLFVNEEDTVLVPLCGKSRDILWLAETDVQVIGVEVSELAVQQFFSEAALSYSRRTKGEFEVYVSENIQLWQGDFFKLNSTWLPPVNVIYDKAALIALPPDRRKVYAKIIMDCCTSSTQMLVSTFEYPQKEMNGPPFSVFRDELIKLYGSQFTIELLYEESILDEVPKFRQWGLSSYLREKCYLLEQKPT